MEGQKPKKGEGVAWMYETLRRLCGGGKHQERGKHNSLQIVYLDGGVQKTGVDGLEWGYDLENGLGSRKEGPGLRARQLLICAKAAVCGKIFGNGLCGGEGVLS